MTNLYHMSVNTTLYRWLYEDRKSVEFMENVNFSIDLAKNAFHVTSYLTLLPQMLHIQFFKS